MLLQPAEDRDFPPFDAGSDRGSDDAGAFPKLTAEILHEASALRHQYGPEAANEVDRRITLAMQDCRLDEINHLWAVWLALEGRD